MFHDWTVLSYWRYTAMLYTRRPPGAIPFCKKLDARKAHIVPNFFLKNHRPADSGLLADKDTVIIKA